ncbi:MAG: hypothetical protein H6Q17_2160 [Bacteroidetes bacterium]|jgi:hypothetical protein|nr:hypothetical protein [Bacteroidota bacterium]
MPCLVHIAVKHGICVIKRKKNATLLWQYDNYCYICNGFLSIQR